MKRPLVALDTECTGPDLLRGDAPFAVSLCWIGSSSDFTRWKTKFYCWPVDPQTRKVQPNVRDVREISSIVRSHRTIFHNAKFDIRALEILGIPSSVFWGCQDFKFDDTLLASHVADNLESHNLKDLALRYLDIPPFDQDEMRAHLIALRREASRLGWNIRDNTAADYWLCSEMYRRRGRTWRDAYQALEKYAVMDARRTAALWPVYVNALTQDNLWEPYWRERKLVPVVYSMESRGVTLRRSLLAREINRYEEKADLAGRHCRCIAQELGMDEDFNIRSPRQLQELLFQRLKLRPTATTPSGQPAIDAASIQEIYKSLRPSQTTAREFLERLMDYRLCDTATRYLKEYYSLAVPEDNACLRLYPSYNQTGTATTRFSGSNPNPQNVGKGKELQKDGERQVDFTLRKVFGPAPGRIWYALDYQQLQLRIFAWATGEEKMIGAFRQGYDFHSYIASVIFGVDPDEVTPHQRRVGKNVNFGYIFGAGPGKIERISGIKGLSSKLKRLFPSVAEFFRSTETQVRRKGCVYTLGGYRLFVPRDKPYIGVNYIVQGTEGDIVKNAMIHIHSYLNHVLRREAWITMQVHDEIILDFPAPSSPGEHRRDLRNLVEIMQNAGDEVHVETPVSCSVITRSWDNPKDITKYVQAVRTRSRRSGTPA